MSEEQNWHPAALQTPESEALESTTTDTQVCSTSASHDDVPSHLATVEKSIGRPMNPTVYSGSEFRRKLADGNHVFDSILKRSKVFLLGDEDELENNIAWTRIFATFDGWLKRFQFRMGRDGRLTIQVHAARKVFPLFFPHSCWSNCVTR